MSRTLPLLKLVLLCGLLTGCLDPRSYPDPAFPMVGYDKVERLSQPLPLRVQVSFERQGNAYARGDTYLRDITERVLRGSGVITPDAAAGSEIKVVVNNFADIGDAAAKGIGTGLTFGLVGTTVSDNYEMSVTVTYAGRTVSRTGLKNAVRSAMGTPACPRACRRCPLRKHSSGSWSPCCWAQSPTCSAPATCHARPDPLHVLREQPAESRAAVKAAAG